MKTYNIVAGTNGYIAGRDVDFNGKTKIIIESNLTLKEARTKLLDMYNDRYDGERPHAANWGLAVIQSRPHCFGAVSTFKDGTRCFDWDSRRYCIEAGEE